jgi:ketosteroid isomerase-like protein
VVRVHLRLWRDLLDTVVAMDRETAQAWLDAYVQAWLTYDPDQIRALFSDDVVYRYHPYDEPLVGADAVVSSWLGESDADGASSRDAPGTYDAHYEPVAVDGDAVVAQGTSTYFRERGGPVDRVYDNCYVMTFDSEGRCREFTEFYMRRPG